MQQELFTGLLLSAPAVEIDSNIAGVFKKIFGKIFAFFVKKLTLTTLDYRLISSIPEEADAYNNDPLVIHTPVRIGVAVGFMAMMSAYKNRLSEISLPLLIMHGSGDRMIPLSASEVIYNNTSSTDKTFELFADSFHEILHDREQHRARDTILNWIIAKSNI
jgi:alpha-beta hydrolase superfamily lysophospholipase